MEDLNNTQPPAVAKTVGTIKDAPEAQWLVAVIGPRGHDSELKDRIEVVYANGSATSATDFAREHAKQHNVQCVVFAAQQVIGLPPREVRTLWEAKGN